MKKYNLMFLIISLIIIATIYNNNKSYILSNNRIIYRGQRVIRASEYLLQKTNELQTTYEDGDKKELFTFEHQDTAHTNELRDYRYIGRKANNYVYFNCIGDDISSCEIWRIVGIFPVENETGDTKYRIKIIRSESIGKYSFDDSSNNYVNSSLQLFLNSSYYNNLSYLSKKMIGISKYYISGDNVSSYNGSSFYNIERGKKTNKSVDFIGNVGLLYPSDYLYTYSGINNSCYSNLANCSNIKDSWMYRIIGEPLWTITQVTDTNRVYTVSANDSQISYNANNELDVYPVVYLNYDVVIESGDGSKINPYQIRPMYDSEIQSELEMLQSNGDLDKTQVNVDDTLSTKSIVIIIISSLFFITGCIFIIKIIIDRRKLKKKLKI
ncbi:MAG: hypothetical protein IJR82_01130 [Bacilli bacterium]|nr:hypothetical protein [Bacilli bacterium]